MRKLSSLTISTIAAAFIVLALVLFGFVQRINSNVAELSPRSKEAKQLRESVKRSTEPLNTLAVLLGIAAAIQLFMLSKQTSTSASDSPNKEDLNELARSISDSTSNLESTDAVQSLRLSFAKMSSELAEVKSREKAIIEKAVDVICITDLESKFSSVSRAAENAWGYKPKELEGQPLSDFIVGEDAKSKINSIVGCANSIDRIFFECKLKKKSGELIDVLWSAHWSASDQGLFCIVHDITERKLAETLVRQSEERLRKTLETLPAGVIISDQNNKIEFVNNEAVRMLRWQTKSLEGQNTSDWICDEKQVTQEIKDGDKIAGRRLIATARRADASTFSRIS